MIGALGVGTVLVGAGVGALLVDTGVLVFASARSVLDKVVNRKGVTGMLEL